MTTTSRLDWSQDATAIADTVERFCHDRLGPEEVHRRDVGHVPPYDLIPAIAEMGLIRAPFESSDGMQILASAGYSSESSMQRYWRDARLYSFGEGTNEIQREIVAREMGLR